MKGFFDLDYFDDEPPEKPKPKKIVFNPAEGKRRAREGMDRVMDGSPDYREQHRRVIDALPRGWIGNNEDIRKIWKPEWPQPHHRNCIGANWNAAIKRGDLVPLPFRNPARIPSSNSRKLNLYKKV